MFDNLKHKAAVLADKGRHMAETAKGAAADAVERLRAAASLSVPQDKALGNPPSERLPELPPAPPADPSRQHVAARPQAMSRHGWRETALIVWDKIFLDRLFLIAAGVAFYVMLSIFPAMTVLVWTFALFANPAQLVDTLADMAFVLPADVLGVIRQQAEAVAAHGIAGSGHLVVLTALFAVWSANAGMKAMIDAMNIIYGQDEKRSFLALNIRSLLFTLGALAVFLATLTALLLTPRLLAFAGFADFSKSLFVLLRWPLLLVLTVVFLVPLNRYGPSRPAAQARWALWGSVWGAVMWLLVSAAFTIYVERLSNLAAFYGSLAAIAGLMLWLWLSALVVLIGIELNHELELRTARWEEVEDWRKRMAEAAAARNAALPPPPQSILQRWGRRLLRRT